MFQSLSCILFYGIVAAIIILFYARNEYKIAKFWREENELYRLECDMYTHISYLYNNNLPFDYYQHDKIKNYTHITGMDRNINTEKIRLLSFNCLKTGKVSKELLEQLRPRESAGC